MTNTAKLKGRIIEYGFNLSTFADEMKLSPPALRKKLTNKTDFRASEILRACKLLNISQPEIPTYFFCG
ncbi:MAG: DUF739 family protein [Clostridia bacterium]|nr:DUF739 family protein [Clostridia bacterium]MBQ3871004.1 DUF739 family protein [Clostridia bacterium]